MNYSLKIVSLIVFFAMTVCCSRYNSQLVYDEDNDVNLYAVIGKKISITEFDPDERYKRFEIDSLTGDTIYHRGYFMDYCFDAKYQVIEILYNRIDFDTIDFVVFNHYGRPLFEESEYVLLYLSKYEESEGFYLQKYQFDIVINDDKGNWKGINGESLRALFLRKKYGVLGNRGMFE